MKGRPMSPARSVAKCGRTRLGCLLAVLTVGLLWPGGRSRAEQPSGRRSPTTRQAARSSQVRAQSERFIKANDRNGDGKLSREEMPASARRSFGRIDKNKDGFITLEEHVAFRRTRSGRQGRLRPPLPKPDHADVRYGPDERNVLDVWLAKADKPAPLVIYYHGGGFRSGDKRSFDPILLKKLLAKGISVAAVNYRLSRTAPFPAQMHECARALQFLRQRARQYNIDGARVGATGGSAGAGISMWLAFHDDLAKPDSKDPVARQSTHLSAAVVWGGQCSYDPRFIKKLFDTDKVHPALISFFGMKGPSDVDDPKLQRLFEEASPINHLSKGDAPVMLYYPQPNTPLPKNSSGARHIHHPKFGIVLKEKMDKLPIKCVLKIRKRGEPYVAGPSRLDAYVEFFRECFAAPAAKP